MSEYAPLYACVSVALAAAVYWLMDRLLHRSARRQKAVTKQAAAATRTQPRH